MDLGVCLVDIGGGTTDLAIFTHGAIRHTAVIPIAGDQITNDIAMALRTPTAEAEAIKTRHGVALRQLADANEMIEVPGIGDPRAARDVAPDAAEVIEPRAEELFSLVQQVLRESGYEELLSSGIVLTGGSSMMQGMVELGRRDLPHAGAHRPAALLRRPGGRGAQPALRHRDGPAAGGRGADPAGQGFAADRVGAPAVFSRMRDWFNGIFEVIFYVLQLARREQCSKS